jgi:hypothetical protein
LRQRESEASENRGDVMGESCREMVTDGVSELAWGKKRGSWGGIRTGGWSLFNVQRWAGGEGNGKPHDGGIKEVGRRRAKRKL